MKKLFTLFALLSLSVGMAQAQTNINPHPFTVRIEAGNIRHVVYFSTETPTKQTWKESFETNPQILDKSGWECLLKERKPGDIAAANFRGWAQLMDESEEHKVTAAYAVLLPDDWAEMYHFYNSAWYKDNEHKEKLFTIGSAFDNNSLKKADMAALQQAGAVFLPCDITDPDGVHANGQYWTSTKEDGFGIYYAYFSTSSTTPSTPEVSIKDGGETTDSHYVLLATREVTITMDENEDNTELLQPWKTHQQPVNVELVRSFTPGMYNTLCLPFDLNAKEVKDVFGETTKLAKFTSGTLSDDKKTLNIEFEDIALSDDNNLAIEAGEPYLIQPDDVVTDPTFKQRVIEKTSADGENFAPNGSIEYLGIINPHQLEAGDNRYLFLQANNKLNWSVAGDNSQMKGMRGYFYVPDMQDMPANCSARLSVRQATQTPTGLGQRTKEQGQRAIKFMRNGKLFIQHNGIIYNMQGGREL